MHSGSTNYVSQLEKANLRHTSKVLMDEEGNQGEDDCDPVKNQWKT